MAIKLNASIAKKYLIRKTIKLYFVVLNVWLVTKINTMSLKEKNQNIQLRVNFVNKQYI